MKSRYFPNIKITIQESVTSNGVAQNDKHDLQKTLAWFIIDYFTHNLDLISQVRKNFRHQNSTDDKVLEEESDFVWDSEWSDPLFINIPTNISSQAIGIITINKDFVKVMFLLVIN